jgi:uncharacterized repeat protein (TIGR02543 family)
MKGFLQFKATKLLLLAVMLLGYNVSFGQTTVSHTFAGTSGNIDSNISFTTQQNNSGTAPGFFSELRLYYVSTGNGGSITLKPSNGAVITKVVMTAVPSYTPTVKYNVDGGSDVSANLNSGVYTIAGINSSTGLKIRNANTTNTQLRVTKIDVTYSISYRLTYNGNGNTGGTAPTVENHASSENVIVAGVGNLSRTGYIFSGWNSNAAGTGTNYAVGSTLSMPASAITLYAKWVQNPTVSVTTATATAIGTNSVTAGGTITASGGATLSARGIVYGTTSLPTINDTKTFDGTTAGSFSTNITGLAVNTRYFYRAYATYQDNTVYGNEMSFYTHANTPSVPLLSNITTNTIDVTIGENANNAATQYVIRVNGSNFVNSAGELTTTETWLSSTTGIPVTLKGLVSNTTYTIDVKARNSASVNTAYSDSVQGTTLTSTAPNLSLVSSDLIFDTVCTNNSVIGSFVFNGANLEPNASVVIFAADGFTYSTAQDGTFTPELSIPNYNTGDVTVWVKFAPTAVQSYNGSISLAAPGGAALAVPVTGQGVNTPASVATGLASDVTGLSATLAGTVTANGCTTITAYGFEYALNNFTNGTGTQVVSNNINNASYTASLTNLSPGATYYYKAFATSAAGTVYGEQRTFTTSAVGIPVTTDATNIGQTSFTANWTAVEGATGYYLDVSTNPNFVTVMPGKTITESFNNVINPGASSSYSTVTWTDSNNIGWTSYKTRTDQVVSDDYAITLRDQADSYLLSNEITGGLTNIKFDTQLKYGSDPDRGTLTIKVLTGSDFTTVTVIGTHTYTEAITTYNSGAIAGITGAYKIVIENDGSERVAIDNLAYTTAPITNSFFIEGYNNLNVNNVTSYTVTGLESFTNYYYRVRAYSANSTSGNSNTTNVITKVGTVTWSIAAGETTPSWNPKVYPDGSQIAVDNTIDVTIAADYNTQDNGLFTAKSIRIQSGTLTVVTGTTLTVEGSVTNTTGAGKFIVQNNAALLQNTAASNVGAITVAKNTNPLYRLDYTMWSSPVSGLTLGNFSPNTAPGRFYEYKFDVDSATGGSREAYFVVDPSTVFAPAKSYLVRMPNASAVEGYNTGDTAIPFNANFIGTPNNGTINIALSTLGNRYTAVGNPYASPINVSDFFNQNTGNIDTTSGIYLWRKKNDSGASTYATLNLTTFVENKATGGGEDQKPFFTGNSDSWILSAGQGFIVKSADGVANPVATFNNSMRRAAPESGNQPILKPGTMPASRLWLNLTNSKGAFSQIAVAYMDNATEGLDYGYDAAQFANGESVSLYSIAANTKLAIQARPAFSAKDVVPVGFVANAAGEYTIALGNADGLFTSNQNIFIKDNLLGTITNVKDGAYTFTTEKGTFAERFEVIYTNSALGTNQPQLDANTVIVYKQDNAININSATSAITGVTVYDVRGAKLYNNNNIDAVQTSINGLAAQQQVLIIEITTLKGKVSKKIIF